METKFNELFNRLVPSEGPAGNLAGETIRAVAKIRYRYYNNGDRIGIGYGRETCNPAARFLLRFTTREIGNVINLMWQEYYITSDDDYERLLNRLVQLATEFVQDHPETETATSCDMYDCRIPWYDKGE